MDLGIVGTGAVGSSPESLALPHRFRQKPYVEVTAVLWDTTYACAETIQNLSHRDCVIEGETLRVKLFDGGSVVLTPGCWIVIHDDDAWPDVMVDSLFRSQYESIGAPEMQPIGSPPNSNPSPKESESAQQEERSK